MEKKLYRSEQDKVIAGVCGGLGEYFTIDPVIVRLLFVVFVVAGGSGIIGYILAWIIIPRRPYIHDSAPRQQNPAGGQSAPPEAGVQYSAPRSLPRYLPGLILIGIGAVLLIRESFYWFSWREFWPILIIGVGVFLIARSGFNRRVENGFGT